jgi:hypothetical protein
MFSRLNMVSAWSPFICVANPHLDAAIPKGLAAAIDLAGVESGDMVVRLAVFSPTGRPAPSRDPFTKA